MPCTLPLGVIADVLKSACASSHNTINASCHCSRQWRATAVIEPIAEAVIAAEQIGRRPPFSSTYTASCRLRFHATTSDIWRKPLTAGRSGLVGPRRFPQSLTAEPNWPMALTIPATRSASGPMLAPRVPAPTSVGTPRMLTGSLTPIRLLLTRRTQDFGILVERKIGH
jgi:hypothetical protein